jgi:hypothetical protein
MRRLVGATFVATQIGSLLSICALGLLPAGSTRHRFDKRLPPLRALFRNGTLIAYVAAFAGNTWETSRCGSGFVAYLAWLLQPSRQSNRLPPLGLVSGRRIAERRSRQHRMAEVAVRRERRPVVIGICLSSVVTCLAYPRRQAGRSGSSCRS